MVDMIVTVKRYLVKAKVDNVTMYWGPAYWTPDRSKAFRFPLYGEAETFSLSMQRRGLDAKVITIKEKINTDDRF